TYTNKLEILYDIATGLTQIHESGLVHRDLHTKNVMCQGIKDRNLGRGEEFRFVIGDLGLAIPPKKDMVYGIISYTAPEVFGDSSASYTFAADIYSFGILMWEILTGLRAFSDFKSETNLMLKICRGMRPAIEPNTPKLYADLMQRCWNDDVNKRPTAREL
ncbi:kinase-like domain-containing protein, partial [Gigaspora rosea]